MIPLACGIAAHARWLAYRRALSVLPVVPVLAVPVRRGVPLFRPWARPPASPEHADAFGFSEAYLSFALEAFVMGGGWLTLGAAQALYRLPARGQGA